MCLLGWSAVESMFFSPVFCFYARYLYFLNYKTYNTILIITPETNILALGQKTKPCSPASDQRAT